MFKMDSFSIITPYYFAISNFPDFFQIYGIENIVKNRVKNNILEKHEVTRNNFQENLDFVDSVTFSDLPISFYQCV